MPGSEYLADNVISAVREEGLIAASDEVSTTSKIRNILNREQRLYLMALLEKAREEYQYDSATVAVVPGTSRYALPSRAAGAALFRVVRVDTSGDVPLWPQHQQTLHAMGGVTYGSADYFLDGNYLVLPTAPTSAATLRVYFPRRFSKAVAGTEACVITNVNAGTKQVTLALASDGVTTTLPSGWTTAATFDFIRGRPHFDILGRDLVVTNVASNVLTFSATLPTELVVGDFVGLAGESPVLTMPLEFTDVLVLKAAHSYQSALGNGNKGGLLKERWAQAEADLVTLISPRNRDVSGYFINYDGPGWNRIRWRRGR